MCRTLGEALQEVENSLAIQEACRALFSAKVVLPAENGWSDAEREKASEQCLNAWRKLKEFC